MYVCKCEGRLGRKRGKVMESWDLKFSCKDNCCLEVEISFTGGPLWG